MVLASDGFLDESEQPLTLPEDAGRSQVVRHLQRRLREQDISEGTRRAATQLLLRHDDQTGDLAAWWWYQFQPSAAWLRTGAELGALTEVPAAQAARLAPAVSAETDACWPVELLGYGGYDDHRDDVLKLCAAQLNDGAADLVEVDLDTPLGKLIDTALVAQLRPRPAAPGLTARRTRHRSSDGRTVLAHYLNSTEPIRIPLTSTAAEQDWFHRLRHVHGLWGDGWVLRQAAALTPISVDLRPPAADEAPALAMVLQAEADRRAYRADPDWWQQTGTAATTALDRRYWLFSVITTAQTKVVTDLAAEVNAASDELTPRQFRSLEAAVNAFSRTALRRDLNLHDALRRGIAGYTARSLWLLRPTTSQPGIEQIDKKLAESFESLLTPGMGDRRQVLGSVGSRIKPDRLRGTREVLPDGWPGAVRLGALSTATADQVLAKPDQWPREIVGAAVQHASSRLARLPPVAQLERDNRWFQID